MGWRGTLRSINATANCMAREAERERKRVEKEDIVFAAEVAVDDWANHIHNLINIHTYRGNSIDWEAIANEPLPNPPMPVTRHQVQIQSALLAFKPKISDIFHGGSKKRHQKLKDQFAEAKRKDQTVSSEQNEAFKFQLIDLENDKLMAQRLLAGESQAIKEIIAESQTLSKDDRVGVGMSIKIDDGTVHAIAVVNDDSIIPTFRRKQLASGRLSETKMPIGEFNELYQDYVASVALRIAGELLNILPLDKVYVTCLANMLNTKTGHKEDAPIMSVKFVQTTFKSLNLNGIDPSDSLRNFQHKMNFKRTKGFLPVEALKSID